MKKIILMTALIATAITLNSCNDDDSSSGDYTYKVRLTDAPGPFSEVNVDIQSVQVVNADGETITLNTEAGVYNLLDYTNGASTVIATSNLENEGVTHVKLILGPNNTVVSNGVTYSLSTTGVDQSGLNVEVNQTLDADTDNSVLIDFDANASIMQTGATTFKLKPVVRNVVTAITGKITGSVSGSTGLALVTATSASNIEFTTNININGDFQINALPAGTYTVTVTPLLPLGIETESNVVVQAGQTTDVGDIIVTD